MDDTLPEKSPEHRLIDLCRELREADKDISFISFRVEREDGDYQTYSLGRKSVDILNEEQNRE